MTELPSHCEPLSIGTVVSCYHLCHCPGPTLGYVAKVDFKGHSPRFQWLAWSPAGKMWTGFSLTKQGAFYHLTGGAA